MLKEKKKEKNSCLQNVPALYNVYGALCTIIMISWATTYPNPGHNFMELYSVLVLVQFTIKKSDIQVASRVAKGLKT